MRLLFFQSYSRSPDCLFDFFKNLFFCTAYTGWSAPYDFVKIVFRNFRQFFQRKYPCATEGNHDARSTLFISEVDNMWNESQWFVGNMKYLTEDWFKKEAKNILYAQKQREAKAE